jgi:hypothetical protein
VAGDPSGERDRSTAAEKAAASSVVANDDYQYEQRREPHYVEGAGCARVGRTHDGNPGLDRSSPVSDTIERCVIVVVTFGSKRIIDSTYRLMFLRFRVLQGQDRHHVRTATAAINKSRASSYFTVQ